MRDLAGDVLLGGFVVPDYGELGLGAVSRIRAMTPGLGCGRRAFRDRVVVLKVLLTDSMICRIGLRNRFPGQDFSVFVAVRLTILPGRL